MRILLIFTAMLLSMDLVARPVSYPGGVTVMQSNDADQNTIHVHYSPTARYSIGYRGEYWREEQWQFHGAQLNYLVKRWNKPATQANIYFKSAVGVAYSDFETFDEEIELAGFVGIAMDWENRRFFTSYENRSYSAGDIESFFTQQVRIGVAPYIGDYGDLHTWLILQVDHKPEQSDSVIATSVVRFLKGDYLVEIGSNDDGDLLFNWIKRF